MIGARVNIRQYFMFMIMSLIIFRTDSCVRVFWDDPYILYILCK